MSTGESSALVGKESPRRFRSEIGAATPFPVADEVLMQGLARLIAGQRCFAEEFGLAYSRVFCEEFEDFKGRPPEEVLREWCGGGAEEALRLSRVIDDLVHHQLALVAALDGIARETVAELSPRRVAEQTPVWLGLRPFAWRNYRILHEELERNQNLRLARLVLPGFVTGYVRAREERGQPIALQQE